MNKRREVFYKNNEEKVEVDAHWKAQHLLVSNMPCLWRERADNLKRASEIIDKHVQRDTSTITIERMHSEENLGLNCVYMMLAGYALESLLKGIYNKFSSMVNESGELKSFWKNRGHFLREITEKINKEGESEIIPLNEKELFLLERLTEYILWAGRYPAPALFEHRMPVIMVNGGAAPLTIITPKDNQRIDELYKRLSDILDSLPQKKQQEI